MGNESSQPASTPSSSTSATSTRSSNARSSGNGFSSFATNTPVSSIHSGQAGAFKMPGQPRNQRFYVTIPRGVRPGQHFAVLVNGQQMMVRCPDGNKPGDRLIVTAPRQQVVVKKKIFIDCSINATIFNSNKNLGTTIRGNGSAQCPFGDAI